MTHDTARPDTLTQDHPRPVVRSSPARSGSLAATLPTRPRTLVTFPGVDPDWPRRLAGTVAGNPWLADWVATVVDTVAEWTREPQQQTTGWFGEDVRDILAGSCDLATASQAPFALAGTVLDQLACLRALAADGLTDALAAGNVVATGHSAGLITATALGGGDAAAVSAVELALAMGIAASDEARRNGLAISPSTLAEAAAASDPDAAQLTPMAAITGPSTAHLTRLLAEFSDRTHQGAELAVTNTRTRHVVSGSAAALQELREFLTQVAGRESAAHKEGRQPGGPLLFQWEPLLNSLPFHHSALAPSVVAAQRLIGGAADALTFAIPVVDPATGATLAGPTALADLIASVLARPQDWSGTLVELVTPGSTVIAISDNSSVHGLTTAALRGTGVPVLMSETPDGRRALFAPGADVPPPLDYRSFRPTRDGDRVVTRHTRLTGRSPVILAGMTPTTVDAGIVAAAANAGHVSELAGGGQVSRDIFEERISELTELLDPGHEVVFNALLLDPYLWDLHLGREKLVQRARAAGAPICGVTVSAGVPEPDEAVALLDELNDLGIWLNAFKPGNARQVRATLEIARRTSHNVWLHLEGGSAGGHHSWDDLEQVLLATYHLIREHDNVVLCVGGGIGTPERAAALLDGSWSRRHGVPAMPTDAVLIGTAAMATAESTASPGVKQLLARVPGVDPEGPDAGWVARSATAGGMTSGRSGLNADIHYVDNAASRAAALLDEVAGDDDSVSRRRDEIITALDRTAKPYFGDLAGMTYQQMLGRFVDLVAVGSGGRYQDGRWLDPTHRSRFISLLQRAEARLHPDDSGRIATLFSEPHTVDDPAKAVATFVDAYPIARTATLHPADVDHFLVVCRQPGKPVPFVPVIDADVRRWYQSDALWQAHDKRYDADEVLIIPGPVAVAGITTVDEPVTRLLDRFEAAALDGLAPADEPTDPVTAALSAPTFTWAGSVRPNPLRRLAGTDSPWRVTDAVAHWESGGETARLRAMADSSLELTLTWPALTQDDGSLSLRIDVVPVGRGLRFEIADSSLAAAGRQAIGLSLRDQDDMPAGDDPGGHAAAVRSGTELPDSAMRRLWPLVFEVIAREAASGTLDLVHESHEILVAAHVGGARITDSRTTPHGYAFEVAAGDATHSTRDRFFVRQPGAQVAGQPQPTPDAVDHEWVDTPHLLLGVLAETAPQRLDTFALVSGDLNPIHRSDAVARLAGLPARIVHGMWTSALGQRAVVELACDHDATRLTNWQITFVAPVEPGAEISATATRTGTARGSTRVEVLIEAGARPVATGVATVAPVRTAYVFPGQGIQHVGMGMDGMARSDAARDVWHRADAHCREELGFSILQVVRDNPTSIIAGEPGNPRAGVTYRHPGGVLHLTQFTQVAMATLASAQVAELRERGVFDETAITAGHSVGEYNALAAVSGVLTLEAVLDLVFARGLAMHHLVPRAADGSSDFRLGVVRPHLAGLDHTQTDALVQDVAGATGGLCEIVNHNLRGKQYAVAGTVAALQELERRLGPGDTGKSPFLLVPGIDVPFHSSALGAGVAEFRAHLQRHLPERIDPGLLEDRYVPNLYPVPFRVTREYVAAVQEACGSPLLAELLADWDQSDPARMARTLLVELLAWQFASPVRWIETTEVITGELAARRVIEVGVGTQPTLANLFKGALGLAGHRGTRPRVLNVETDADEVFEQTATPVVQPVADDEPGQPAAAEPAPAPTPARATTAAAPPADQKVDHATAVGALVAIRTGLRPDQLGADSIEALVDGASSRRNQLLMDIGKEFAVSGIDGAHEVPLDQVAATLSDKAAGYRFPGPVLSVWLDAELGATLGRLASGVSALDDRVGSHWGLGEGWAHQAMLELALGCRQGSSRRGGDLATLSGSTAPELIDAAVLSAGARLGITVAPATEPAGAGTADPAALRAATERIESLLADSATDLLARLDRSPDEHRAAPDDRATHRLATLDTEHGPERAAAVEPVFDVRRHVLLESGTAWARADVDHLVHRAALGSETAVADVESLIDQIALHRDSDPRIGDTLRWYSARAHSYGAHAGRVDDAIDAALRRPPAGVAVDIDAALAALPADQSGGQRFRDVARSLTREPGDFAGEVALVTGASPGSIALSAVTHLLRGSATVVLVTSSDSEERIAAYRDLERRHAGPGAQLHVIRANLASFADVDDLVEWLTTPTTEAVGASTREVKPALWPTLLLPFAAGPAGGSLADTGSANEVTLRLMLLGVQRLIGALGERLLARRGTPVRVVLPMSPNHGSFGGDGSYGDTKAALETVVNRWAAEQRAWAAGTRLVAAEIGWVRGTGLMGGNDAAAAGIERELGVRTFTADEMGTLIAAACSPDLSDLTDQPWRLDLTGGLSRAGGVADALARAATAAEPEPDVDQEEPALAALPNLPWARSTPFHNGFEVDPQIDLDEMVVIAGIAELGPWGASSTRWEAELGRLSADAITELAWRMGLITWNGEAARWVDAAGDPLDEHDVRERFEDLVQDRVGVRTFEDTAGVAAGGTTTLAEVYLDRPLTIGAVSYPAGTAIRVPTRRALQRQVGGQFPVGADPTRHGLDTSVAQSMDPLAAWNLVVTAEAFASAGLTPEELAGHVHPSRIGNTQGTGMGGMGSLHALYLDPLVGKEHANDLLQEALGNVVSAHVNQSLVGGYGPMVHPVAACATAAVSLEEAVDKIRLRKADIVIGGGWDDLSSEGINGFADMSATADNEDLIASGIAPRGHSRPGDRRRRGFVESQGGGSFVVTRGSVALRLGLPVRAVVAYAASFGDGVQTSIPAPGLGALGAARGGGDSPLATALRRHGLVADDIAVVSKHDTSTNANDPNEAMIHATISATLGRTAGAPLRVISQKSVTGHAKGGAAAWQLAGLCDVFATGIVPGNRNLTSVDPEVTPGPLVVDYRNLQRAEPVRAAVLTSLGFGHVSALVALAHPAVFEAAIPESQRESYRAASGQRLHAGQREILAARHGAEPIFHRRTERLDRTAEVELLLGGAPS